MLAALAPRVAPGSVLVFDEFVAHETWRADEARAWDEACARHGWRYDVLAVSLVSKQAVVRVRDVAAAPPPPPHGG